MFRAGQDPHIVGGPGEPPTNGAFASRSEWIWYWASEKVLGPEDPDTWRYQDPAMMGATRAGSTRIDFVYYGPRRIACRIQTERFHLAVAFRKQGYDVNQRVALEQAGWNVVDVYEEQYIHDRSGQTAIILLKRVLANQEAPNPITTGTTLARPARFSV